MERLVKIRFSYHTLAICSARGRTSIESRRAVRSVTRLYVHPVTTGRMSGHETVRQSSHDVLYVRSQDCTSTLSRQAVCPVMRSYVRFDIFQGEPHFLSTVCLFSDFKANKDSLRPLNIDRNLYAKKQR
jgi:hypothetical protein